ncbi:hypothetical protein FF38_00511 [Lucilia cuprina]|uniref:Uncharacterized protein n=1 Tax=Lucilia cuprina TaxID=7375 RepID=A0A0L0CJP1_LUCCU|nr:hypothetical protein FF38_00511 [Lucilia cuprina]
MDDWLAKGMNERVTDCMVTIPNEYIYLKTTRAVEKLLSSSLEFFYATQAKRKDNSKDLQTNSIKRSTLMNDQSLRNNITLRIELPVLNIDDNGSSSKHILRIIAYKRNSYKRRQILNREILKTPELLTYQRSDGAKDQRGSIVTDLKTIEDHTCYMLVIKDSPKKEDE